ncbi:MAG TPA: hypothetical protein VN903_27685 [Polyangia bacterium]|nr:hypothetical protein [Polyangia bacterium]
MATSRRLLGWGPALFVGVASTFARAEEPADRGISLSAWAGTAFDRSVADGETGRPLRDAAPLVGATGLGNIEQVAIGGAVDASPGTAGEGRLSLSALLGWQPQIGATRYQLLGEAGGHRFTNVGGRSFTRQEGPETWLPFAGVRLGAARTYPAHSVGEVGVWMFGRYDLRQTTVTNVSGAMSDTRTDYRVGGYMVGLAVQVGLRFESPHPWNQGTVWN